MEGTLVEWKNIPDFPYSVSNTGNLRNNKTGRILKPGIVYKGYHKYKLCKDKIGHNVSIHRLVAKAFIPNPDNKPCVDHVDGKPGNNHVSNLRWATLCENNQNKRQVYGAVPFRGVAKHLNGKFQAHISLEGRSIHLGLFKTAEEAFEMYDAVASGFYGEFYAREN